MAQLAGLSSTHLFLIGGGIGLTVAFVGAFVEYMLFLRPDSDSGEEPHRLQGCLIFVVGGLLLVGGMMLITSLLFTGAIRTGLVMVIGVFVGFYMGFFILFFGWFLFARKRPSPKQLEQ